MVSWAIVIPSYRTIFPGNIGITIGTANTLMKLLPILALHSAIIVRKFCHFLQFILILSLFFTFAWDPPVATETCGVPSAFDKNGHRVLPVTPHRRRSPTTSPRSI